MEDHRGIARPTGTCPMRHGSQEDAILEIGRQLLITRRTLATSGIAVDLAKYLSIIPVVFAATYPDLSPLNILRLTNARSAIVSAVIFNILVAVPLLLLAVRTVRAGAQPASHAFNFSLWIYGLGGLLVPWDGIKLIDVSIVAFGFV